jgi:hypothetical protein
LNKAMREDIIVIAMAGVDVGASKKVGAALRAAPNGISHRSQTAAETVSITDRKER